MKIDYQRWYGQAGYARLQIYGEGADQDTIAAALDLTQDAIDWAERRAARSSQAGEGSAER